MAVLLTCVMRWPNLKLLILSSVCSGSDATFTTTDVQDRPERVHSTNEIGSPCKRLFAVTHCAAGMSVKHAVR